MTRFGSLLLFTTLLACNTPTDKPATKSAAEITPAQLISPGQSIGQLTIGMPADSALARLGRPDASDAAMGSALMAWYGKDAHHYRTAVFTSMNMGNENFHRIKRIMVSSPWFKTADGLGAGTPLAVLAEQFRLKKVADAAASQKGLLVYTAVGRGISFDIDSLTRICKAVTVHPADEQAAAYINMHE
ncbi:hypothetical protein [Emticicia sp. 21SJ11W-3]|uniref:hypothetical protein n=1 Tax=Emticicia sp. 21SJ11W-3 TaxID=2916755 RepID=UPI00209E9104|nr:hypothetical protein [Emticicia sp. 21SJ11W-3]UTA66488.1 hypothetical protein MB380_12850 [Emticicia sp. 21SJ11W-3]